MLIIRVQDWDRLSYTYYTRWIGQNPDYSDCDEVKEGLILEFLDSKNIAIYKKVTPNGVHGLPNKIIPQLTMNFIVFLKNKGFTTVETTTIRFSE